VEFAGDDKRLQLPGSYNKDEALVISEIFKKMIMQLF